MTFDEAVKLVSQWPGDRSVPRKLKAGIDAATGLDQALMGQLVEALIVAAETPADMKLIQKFFE